jgi:DNA primase
MASHALSVYDRLRPHLSAEDILGRLGVEVVRRLGSEVYCRPLCHDSTSGESLQVNVHTGRWNCKACQNSGISGDMIQFVEYVQTGGRAPSKGSEQHSSSAHREAVRWLCEQYAVPYDDDRRGGDPALDVVHIFAMAAHEHLLRSPNVLEWIQEKWGFDRATVEAYGIGFMPSPLLPLIAVEANRPESRAAFRSSGIGFYPPDGSFTTRFEGRVIFPYLEHGRAVYLIGRSTPWTPARDDGGHVPKYHKLTVHSDQRPYVSEKITNDHLYLEPTMDGATTILVAEGVADAVASSTLGVPTVSPVTISFNKVDRERFVRKCKEKGIRRVELLFDNELSGSGNVAAVRTGVQLVEAGLCVLVLTLPLGPKQVAARDEVMAAIGAEAFRELEQADPRRRKEIIAERVPDDRREWVMRSVEDSKIDTAEWVAMEGAAAAEKFTAIRRAGIDVISMSLNDTAALIDAGAPPQDRLDALADVVRLAACVDDKMARAEYAGWIAKAAGKGVTKSDAAQRISAARKLVLAERNEEEREVHVAEAASPLVLLPPDAPPAPRLAPPPVMGSSVVAPPPRVETDPSEHEKYAPVRDSVMRAVEKKASEEAIGKHVSQTITISMGFTAFRTPDELVLVRGNERVDVGVSRVTPAFSRLLYLASALTPSKNGHRSYIAAVVYFLELESTRVSDVSWSHYERDSGTVFFPTGDSTGSIFQIATGAVYRTKMSEVKVPAVAGHTFLPIKYVDDCGGSIDAIYDTLKWISLSPSDRLILLYWVVCLPILRRVGEIPIVRIEGGSSSGKSRAVDAVSFLVNGRKTSVVPTAAAMTSSLAVEMLTIDDNRESRDMTESLRSTLLQATGLGARQKRKANSDTGTVIERVCGALLMNGIEPVHDGRSELASRMLTLRSDSRWRSTDSPRAEEVLFGSILRLRDKFWSEAVSRCSQALDLDRRWGEDLGLEIESIFGSTRIGRLSVYLRLMYLAWVAGRPLQSQQGLLDRLAEPWVEAFSVVGSCAMQSLLHEELAVSAMRYAFSYCKANAVSLLPGGDERRAFDGIYTESLSKGDSYLGPLSSSRLARLVRAAGKDMNAPRSIATDLSAGQLLARIQDGLGFLADAGFAVELMPTQRGKTRLSIYRAPWAAELSAPAGESAAPAETWAPD